MIAKSAKIRKNVKLGRNVAVEEYVLIGIGGKAKTLVGDNSVIRSHTVIYSGNQIGENFHTGHGVLIREDNDIGDNVSVGSHTDIEHHVTIEDDVRIHSNVFLPEYSTLKKGSWVGPGAVFTNAKYPKTKDVKKTLKGPTVCEDAIIGANVTLLPGVTIGPRSLIGAGAVVVSDVEADSVYVGCPAKKINKRSKIPGYGD